MLLKPVPQQLCTTALRFGTLLTGTPDGRSRIGVLTTSQEEEIKQLLATLAQFHVFCTVAAAAVATKRGNGLQKTSTGCLKVTPCQDATIVPSQHSADALQVECR